MIHRMVCFILFFCMITVPVAGMLPASFDLRDVHAVTPAKSQGDVNTCWAFGVVSAAESNIILKGYADAEAANLSEMHLSYFTYNRDPISIDVVIPGLTGLLGDYVRLENATYLEAGGNEIFATFALASWLGFVNESVVPYAPRPAPVPAPSLAYTADSYHLANSWWLDFDEPDLIKRMLMECGAASVGYFSDDMYYRGDTFSYYCGNETKSTHSVSLIGWDDNFSRNNFLVVPPGDGAWLVKNSWGTAFGDEGCIWISYYDTSLDSAVFYDVVPSDDYDYNYQYDGGILPTSMPITAGAGDAEITVSAANVFVSEGWERLSAVSFFTFNENVSYTVFVSTGDMGIGNTLQRVQNGTEQFCGYHTVVLENDLLLRPGQVFSVTVMMSAPSDTIDFFGNAGLSLPLDLMDRAEGIFSYSSSEAGESYLHDAAGGSWVDIGAHGDVNARIKAFTINTAGVPAWALRPAVVVGQLDST
ncbi:MAG: lectin like domain-containing protein [Methanocorpusculum sp.]|nr:lectin like domain-containing protein [Methanocorpusculum sp.]